ncbi:MAG: hypothetical protein ACI89D_000543 [Bermanella sp.]
MKNIRISLYILVLVIFMSACTTKNDELSALLLSQEPEVAAGVTAKPPRPFLKKYTQLAPQYHYNKVPKGITTQNKKQRFKTPLAPHAIKAYDELNAQYERIAKRVEDGNNSAKNPREAKAPGRK